MKNFYMAILLILTGSFAKAQNADGYYITKTNDTIRGKIEVPLHPKIKIGASSQITYDPLGDDVTKESKEINFSKLTFDFRFSEDGSKFKKIDRLKVKGFGFLYKNQAFDFVTWDVTTNKQIYMMPATGDVAPDGVYFILRTVNGALPLYSLFQEIEMQKRTNPGPKVYDGVATKRDIIIQHPSKGFIYVSDQYPMRMKLSDALNYLDIENEFIRQMDQKEPFITMIKKYNNWKLKKD